MDYGHGKSNCIVNEQTIQMCGVLAVKHLPLASDFGSGWRSAQILSFTYRSASQPPHQLHLLVEACEPPPDPGLHFSLVALELLWFLSRGHQNHVSSQWEASWDNTWSVCILVVFSVYSSFWIDVIVAFLLVTVLLSFELSDTEMNLPAHKSPLQCFEVVRWVSPMSPRTKYKGEMQLTGAAYRNAFFSRVPKALYLGSFAV